MRIQTLSAHVANQIAAGEVIERPASVVKELLENALDAKANNIVIDIGFGGLNQIKMSDDGEGIVAEDLPLAVASHATSKLRRLADLYHIESMGFRGEALASICAVARVTLQSRTVNDSHATALESDERGIRIKPCAGNQGTTVDVRDLFYNAPVRKKFLKPALQEYQAIEMVVKRIAFCQPHVALTLRHNGKICLQLPSASSEQARRMRLTKLLGKAFADHAVFVDVTHEAMRLHGWLSDPEYARSQQDKLWFYINQRLVRDKLVLHAIKQAYASILPQGRYPACVLFLTLPSDAVDVNVHPSKYEVRFAQPRTVHDLIHLAIQGMYTNSQSATSSEQALNLIPDDTRQPQHVFKPLQTSQQLQSLQMINTQFALMTHASKWYLVDFETLYRRFRCETLKVLSTPWPTRQLLVPVILDLPENNLEKLVGYQHVLQKRGFVLEHFTPHQVRVLSIPKALPGLLLSPFLSAFCESFDGDDDALVALFVHFETVDLTVMNDTEQQALIEYWISCLKHQNDITIPLDIEHCRSILSWIK